MAKNKIVIDGYIGAYFYSKQFIREMLKGTKDETEVTVSSLGGDLDHAIDIHNQFAEHGNIVINYSGFNASSATVLGLKAKLIRMSENSFYLIHKTLMWVDEFGYFNDDDFDELIGKLEKKKEIAAKTSLVIAKMYSEKTGMSIKDTLDLMKEEMWLTAEEAKEKGFIDEIYKPAEVQNYLADETMMAMVVASGYPTPVREKDSTVKPDAIIKPVIDEENLFTRLLNRIKEHFSINPNSKNQMSKPDLMRLLKAANVAEFVMNADGTITLTAEVAQAIEKALEANETATAALQQKVDDSSQLQAKFSDLELKLKTANETIAKLEKSPGEESATINKETDSDAGSGNEEGFFARFSRLKNLKNQ